MKTLEAGLTALPGAFREATRGALTVELALLAPVLAALLVGAIDFGSYIHQKMQLQNASRAGAQSRSRGTETPRTAPASRMPFVPRPTSMPAPLSCPRRSAAAPTARNLRVTVSNTFAPLFDYPGLPSAPRRRGSPVEEGTIQRVVG